MQLVWEDWDTWLALEPDEQFSVVYEDVAALRKRMCSRQGTFEIRYAPRPGGQLTFPDECSAPMACRLGSRVLQEPETPLGVQLQRGHILEVPSRASPVLLQ